MRRISLYGGTFDPVHDGHLAVARSLLGGLALDEVLFVPAYLAPHKRSAPPTPAWHRHAMLVLATQGEPRMRITTAELDAPEKPYTVETLARLRAEHGVAARLFFIMGADSWAEIKTWREWERLLLTSDHVVMTRPGYALDASHVGDEIRGRVVDLRGAAASAAARELEAAGGTPRIYLTDAVQVNVSSTAVRRAALARGGDEAKPLPVPPAVAEYVRKYDLYRNTHETERASEADEAAREQEARH